MSSRIVCFQCGHALAEYPKLNQLPNGTNCPSCVERAYDMVPGPLPAAHEASPFEAEPRQAELFPDVDEPA